MSGIFNGDSIYKSGGGGGGYADGGQLVDGDFIEAKNNTVSSYENVSRDPVNFYFEVKDGEILNSVVELTTAVNATVNVYVLKNGFYYILGNVGGNTVNAGDDYKVNITGDSYSIENVTTPPQYPNFVSLMGIIYPLCKIGNLLFTARNFEGDIGTNVKTNGTTYYLPRSIKDYEFGNGFAIPNRDDFNIIQSEYPYPYTGKSIKSNSGWYNGGNGDNSSGMDIKPYGYYNNGIGDNTRSSYLYFKNTENGFYRLVCYYNSDSANLSDQNYVVDMYYNLRLVYRT